MENLLDRAKAAMGSVFGHGNADLTVLGRNETPEKLHKLLKDLWDKSDSRENATKENRDYWDGQLVHRLTADVYFPDQKKTNGNIVKPIIETKLKNMLDAQFSISVVPNFGSFYDSSMIKQARDVADVFDDALRQVFKLNDIESIEEMVGRDGYIAGFGCSEVEFDRTERTEGDVKIRHIDSIDVRVPAGSTPDDLPYIGYAIKRSPYYVKNRYARNPDGSFDKEKCEAIDKITTIEIGGKDRKQNGNVINYTNDDNNTAGRAFVESHSGGIQGGKVVNLVVMYLLDDSVYAPEQNEGSDKAKAKEVYKRAFPYGRKCVFSVSDENKLVLLDEPLDESFKSLGNIDIFNVTATGDIYGKSDVSDLAPYQDRINALYKRYRDKISGDYDTLPIDDDLGVADSAIVRGPLLKIRDYSANQRKIGEPISNGGIEKAFRLLEMVDKIRKDAYEFSRLNETMLYGSRQTGTTSAEQVEALQESPMADIRANQRNFKNWLINVAEKCLLLMVKNYSGGRFIELTTGINGANLARIDKGQIELIKEAHGTIQRIGKIEIPQDLKLMVECDAGTKIPRSRKETAALSDKISVSPVMQSGNIELMDLYLSEQDYPARRSLMRLLRKQAEESAKAKMSFSDVLKNPALSKSAADIITALAKAGFTVAVGQILDTVGLHGKADTLEDAPVQSIASKADIKDIVATTPGKVSGAVPIDSDGRRIGAAIIDKEHGGKNAGSQVPEMQAASV